MNGTMTASREFLAGFVPCGFRTMYPDEMNSASAKVFVKKKLLVLSLKMIAENGTHNAIS